MGFTTICYLTFTSVRNTYSFLSRPTISHDDKHKYKWELTLTLPKFNDIMIAFTRSVPNEVAKFYFKMCIHYLHVSCLEPLRLIYFIVKLNF